MKIIKTIFITLVLMSFFILSKVNAEEFVQVFATESYISGEYVNGYTFKTIEGTSGNLLFPALDSFPVNNLDLSNIEADVIQFNFMAGYYKDSQTFTPISNWENIAIHASYNSRTVVPCNVNGTGQFIVRCPIPKTDRVLTRISFTTMGLFNWRVGIHQYINAMKSDTAEIINSNQNSNQDIIDNQNQNQQQTHQDMQNINNSLNNNNVSGANQDANSFVNNQAFQDNTGLTGIITAPLSVINSLTSSCSPIRLPIPYLDTNVDIPCIGDLLSSKMGALIQLVKVVINGYICYLIGLDMFKIVKHARDPDDDRIEVLDL